MQVLYKQKFYLVVLKKGSVNYLRESDKKQNLEHRIKIQKLAVLMSEMYLCIKIYVSIKTEANFHRTGFNSHTVWRDSNKAANAF